MCLSGSSDTAVQTLSLSHPRSLRSSRTGLLRSPLGQAIQVEGPGCGPMTFLSLGPIGELKAAEQS